MVMILLSPQPAIKVAFHLWKTNNKKAAIIPIKTAIGDGNA
jgi:hypothetical protein